MSQQYDHGDQINPPCESKQYADLFKEELAALYECSDTIEKVITFNADLIQDFHYKFLDKAKTTQELERLKAESWDKLDELIHRKLSEIASDNAIKRLEGMK